MLGIYKIKTQYMEPVLVVLMRNLIGPAIKEVTRIYDLKGSTAKRLSPPTSNPLSVMKDMNFLHYPGDKLKLEPSVQNKLVHTLASDSKFLR